MKFHRAPMLASFAVIGIVGGTGDLSAQADAGEAARPNILLFLSDDMGWSQPGFNGGTEVTTPSMDRIAGEGVRLTQFYVQPVCTATRGSLLTGRYPWKNGTEGRFNEFSANGMAVDERTLAEVLRDAGYATWIVGKWHLGQWHPEHLPLQRGFDHHYGLYGAEIHSFTHHRGRNREITLDWHRNGRPVVEAGYSTFLLADEAVALIERHEGSRPFFLYLPFNAVHNPNHAPRDYIDRYGHLDEAEQRAQLKAMDDAIGLVMNALTREGVLDDTLVVFLNDNGGPPSAGWNDPYRGKKSEYHEGGIRVPAVMRWPGQIPSGSQSNELLHVIDLFPTLAGLAGADTGGGLPLDGVDAWETIARGAASLREELVYSLDVIRRGDWKLIEGGIDYYGWTTEEPELYDIAHDPYEQTNLASSNTGKLAELRARLDYHRPFARNGEPAATIPGHPPTVYGAPENGAHAARVERAVQQRRAGNLGPALVRLEAAGDKVKLVYDEALDTGSVPPAGALRIVVGPGRVPAAIAEVDVSGTDVVLTLAARPGAGTTVGLTYEVPDARAIRDVDGLEAAGTTWTAVTVGAASDATLSALRLSGVDIGTFSGSLRTYTADVAAGVRSTTVTATATDPLATVSMAPGTAVDLAEGANEITVTVTAEDRTTTNTYTVTVTRASLPVVSVVAVEERLVGPIGSFELSRTGPTTEPLRIRVSFVATRSNGRPQTMTVQFHSGARRVTSRVQSGDNGLVEGDIVVTYTVLPGQHYNVSAEKGSAALVLEESEVAELAVSVEPAEIAEGGSATVEVAVTNLVRFATSQSISLSTSGTAGASDFGALPATLTLPARALSVTTALAATVDDAREAEETVTVTASHAGASLGSATVTITDSPSTTTPLTAQFLDMPEAHDGNTAFEFELRFSEEVRLSYRTLRDSAFELTDATVLRARRVVRGSNLRWTIRVRPASDADAVLALPATTDCAASAAICTRSGKPLSNQLEATVAGPGG